MTGTDATDVAFSWPSFPKLGETPELGTRDAAYLVLSDLDYDSQLVAIHRELHRHREDEAKAMRDIEKIETVAASTSGIQNEAAVGAHTDRLHELVYEDAARSMSAVGMLAPFVESIFFQAYQGLRVQMAQANLDLPAHERWGQADEDMWNCHYVWKNGERRDDLVRGIAQLNKATGMRAHLPSDLNKTLGALFGYRNKMFHCGFEWPEAERERFKVQIENDGWPPAWFEPASIGETPWMFYMSDEFIGHCLKTIDQVICGIGGFCKAQFVISTDKDEGVE